MSPIRLPEELDLRFYRNYYPDLSAMDDSALRRHFRFHGREEGRFSNLIFSRHEFISLIPPDLDVLEIGPFYTPVLKGPKVRYFDVLSKDALYQRAMDHGLPVNNIPFIHYVDPYGDLRTIQDRFDLVLSSHVIEHQPDLVDHLQAVAALLRPGGYYFLMIPDKRYIFDHFLPETQISEIIARHLEKQKTHSLKSVIEHRALLTHNEPARHWAGDHGSPDEGFAEKVHSAIREFQDANGRYIDVHASQFTPASFERTIRLLRELGWISFEICRTYHTRRDQNEFCVVLQLKS